MVDSQRYETQSELQTSLNPPFKHEVPCELDRCKGTLSKLLIDSETVGSEVNSHNKPIFNGKV